MYIEYITYLNACFSFEKVLILLSKVSSASSRDTENPEAILSAEPNLLACHTETQLTTETVNESGDTSTASKEEM